MEFASVSNIITIEHNCYNGMNVRTKHMNHSFSDIFFGKFTKNYEIVQTTSKSIKSIYNFLNNYDQ